jgi:magnesium transporter
MRQVTIDIKKVKELISKKALKSLRTIIQDQHPVDLAEVLEELSHHESIELFKVIDFNVALDVLAELGSEKRFFILTNINPRYTTQLLNEMSADDLADFLGELPEEKKNIILSLLETREQSDIRGLLSYDENTAGGLMTTEYIAFSVDLKSQEALNRLSELAPDAETVYYVYAVDSMHRLVGVVSLRDLILAPAQTPIREFMSTDVKKVKASMDQEDVAKLIKKYGFLALPVVDDNDVLLGIVTVDDVMEVVEEETTEDMLKLAGSDEKLDTRKSSPWMRAKRRLPWIMVAVMGEIISGSVINNFSYTIKALVALSFFIPVLMDMGGNVGTQSAAIVVRGLATGEINPASLGKNILRESVVGIILGAINGTLIALIAYIWQGEIVLGIAVGIAMALNLTLAAILGTLMPFLWYRMGHDPAVAAGPFVTTALDIVGLFIYFSAAAWILKA